MLALMTGAAVPLQKANEIVLRVDGELIDRVRGRRSQESY
jgi:hypothetical protein